MTAVSHITISPPSSYLAHMISVNPTPSPAHTRRFKPWSPLYRLPTHVILVSPRTCRSQGAAICTYLRWFRRTDGQQGHRLRAGVFGHASTSKRAHELLRFRLGCHTLPSVAGRRAGIPRSERLCPLCMRGVGDEKHLVFECSALNGIRLRFPHLFTGLLVLLCSTNMSCTLHARTHTCNTCMLS